MNWLYNTCIMKNSLLIFKRICPKGFEDIQMEELLMGSTPAYPGWGITFLPALDLKIFKNKYKWSYFSFDGESPKPINCLHISSGWQEPSPICDIMFFIIFDMTWDIILGKAFAVTSVSNPPPTAPANVAIKYPLTWESEKFMYYPFLLMS